MQASWITDFVSSGKKDALARRMGTAGEGCHERGDRALETA